MFSKLQRVRGRFVLIGLMLALPVTGSCIFEPRATTEPTAVGGRDILAAQEPEMVISNLVTIMGALDSGNYPDLFAEDFYFIPDPEDLDFMNNYYGPGIYLNWFKPVEVTVTNQLFDRLDKTLVEFDQLEVPEDTDSTYIVYYEYTLKILPRGETWKYFYGIAHFYLRRSQADNFWYMYRWNDFRPPNVPDDSQGTWGLLKGEIRATT